MRSMWIGTRQWFYLAAASSAMSVDARAAGRVSPTRHSIGLQRSSAPPVSTAYIRQPAAMDTINFVSSLYTARIISPPARIDIPTSIPLSLATEDSGRRCIHPRLFSTRSDSSELPGREHYRENKRATLQTYLNSLPYECEYEEEMNQALELSSEGSLYCARGEEAGLSLLHGPLISQCVGLTMGQYDMIDTSHNTSWSVYCVFPMPISLRAN